MHVPGINKNLVSVFKFGRDDHVFFEFLRELCFVKSQVTKEIILQGWLKNGLYIFDNISLAKIPYFVHTLLVVILLPIFIVIPLL